MHENIAGIAEMSPATGAPERYQVGDLLVDCATRQVVREGRELALPGLSFDLLLALVRHAPRFLSVDELMEQVWPGRVVNAETVAKRVELVREALGDDSQEPRYIALVRGRGYRLIPSVLSGPQSPGGSEGRFVPVSSRPAIEGSAPAGPRAVVWSAIALVAIAAVAWIALRLFAPREQHQAAQSSAAAQRPSVAVLPFLNLSDDPSNVYLSDGISEELLGALARTPHLRVVSHTSSFVFRNKETPLPEIARALNVTHILEGSVRKVGNRIRISAQLIEVASDSHLWAQTYDRELKDVFAIEDDISRSIVTAMRAKLGADEPHFAAAAAPSTQNFDAYELYLHGRQLWHLRGESNIRQSIQLLERATELDPQFAGAHAALAQAYSTVNYWYAVPDEHAIERATRSAARAIELDPTLSDAYAAQGEIAEQQMQWQRAEAGFRRAIELNPNDATALFWLGELLFATGRTRDALPAMLKALDVDPSSPIDNAFIGVLYLNEGDFEKGCPYTQRAAELTVTTVGFPWWHRVRCLEHAGQFAAAREAERTGERVAGFRQPALTLIRRAMENPAEKPAALAAIQEGAQGPLRVSYGLPSFLLVGEPDLALDIVEDELRRHNDTVLMTLWGLEAKEARKLPRFRKLVERVGLVDYWRQNAWASLCRPTADSFDCD